MSKGGLVFYISIQDPDDPWQKRDPEFIQHKFDQALSTTRFLLEGLRDDLIAGKCTWDGISAHHKDMSQIK